MLKDVQRIRMMLEKGVEEMGVFKDVDGGRGIGDESYNRYIRPVLDELCKLERELYAKYTEGE